MVSFLLEKAAFTYKIKIDIDGVRLDCMTRILFADYIPDSNVVSALCLSGEFDDLKGCGGIDCKSSRGKGDSFYSGLGVTSLCLFDDDSIH